MPRIGPFTFTTFSGRLIAASIGTITTLTGRIRVGPAVASPRQMRSVESFTTMPAAWARAWQYRRIVGGTMPVVDDTGIVANACLINDCRTTVRPLEGGQFELVAAWTVIPPIGYGDYGQALQNVTETPASPPAPASPVTSSTPVRIVGSGASITYATATGDVQFPLSFGQLRDVANNARALQVDNVAVEPPPAGGTLLCEVGLADDQAAFRLQGVARLMVGTPVNVELGGVTIYGAVLRDAQVTWTPRAGLPSGQAVLAQVVYEMEVQDDDSASGDTGPSVVEVQTAQTWGSWATVAGAFCDDAEEALFPGLGHLSWSLDLGTTLIRQRSVVVDPRAYSGRWCRIRLKLNEKDEPDPRGLKRADLWHGVVTSTSTSFGSGSAGATMTATCSGVLAAWDQLYLLRWYEADGLGDVADPGEVLDFNGRAGGDAGDALAVGASTVTVHDRQNTDAARRWSALKAVNVLLAALRAQYPSHPAITLGGQASAALDFIADWRHLDGKPFGQQVAAILDPRRGIVWKVEITGNAWLLRVSTTVGAATAIPGLGNIPANDRQRTLDLTTKSVTTGRLTEDIAHQVDRLLVQGERPWFAATLDITFADDAPGPTSILIRGWTSGDQAAWETADENARERGGLALVWRKFKLTPNWNGAAYPTPSRIDILRMARSVVTDDAHGAGGESGAFGIGGVKPDASNLRFTREIPLWGGRDWTDPIATGGGIDAPQDEQLEGPVLIGELASGDYELLTDRWQVQVCDDAPAIILGRNAVDAADIADYLAIGNRILVTMGVVGPLPWRVSWRRPVTDQPRDLERVLLQQRPDMGYRLVLDGTAVGIEDDGTLAQTIDTTTKTGAQGTDIAWNIPGEAGAVGNSLLDPLLQLGRLWAEPANTGLTWETKAVIDYATATGPGSWITTAVIPLDEKRSYTATIGNVVTSRRWKLSGTQISTTYHSSRILLALDYARFGRVTPPTPLPLLGQPTRYQG